MRALIHPAQPILRPTAAASPRAPPRYPQARLKCSHALSSETTRVYGSHLDVTGSGGSTVSRPHDERQLRVRPRHRQIVGLVELRAEQVHRISPLYRDQFSTTRPGTER